MGKIIEKTIRACTVLATTTSQELRFFQAPKPGKILGVRWQITGRTANVLSKWSTVHYDVHIAEDGAPATQLAPVQTASGNPYNLLLAGIEEKSMGSGVLSTVFDEKGHSSYPTQQFIMKIDKTEGTCRTSRKVKTGDALVMAVRSDTLLGVELRIILTTWYEQS